MGWVARSGLRIAINPNTATAIPSWTVVSDILGPVSTTPPFVRFSPAVPGHLAVLCSRLGISQHQTTTGQWLSILSQTPEIRRAQFARALLWLLGALSHLRTSGEQTTCRGLHRGRLAREDHRLFRCPGDFASAFATQS